MKKTIIFILIFCMVTAVNAYAFDLKSIETDKSFLMEHDVQRDVSYLGDIAKSYADRFIVRKNDSCDISEIDRYFRELTEKLTVEQLDKSEMNVSNDFVFDEELKKQLNLLGTFGGFAGYRAEFEVLGCYDIYRDISLVGGYIRYHKEFQSYEGAYWNCVCEIEELTREVISYDTRIKMLDKIRELDSFMDNNKDFYIFILNGGKINSLWRCVNS